MRCFFMFLIAICLFFHNVASATERKFSTEDLFNMSFEELLNLKVDAGNITGIDNHRTPVSITTISKQDIQVTPARNLYDLIETYVPGALWMNHHDSPKLGLNGIITDRNYKFLLLVNGRNVNNKARNGATIELENWDLNDIERVEVIRGPGSVTYGPGAIAGVINIITKNYDSEKELEVSMANVYPYKSNGISINYSRAFKNLNFSLYGSIFSTMGWKNTKGILVQGTRTYGYLKYMGENFLADSSSNERIVNRNAQDYMADYEDIPQIKLNAELNIYKEFNINARYSSSGATEYGVFFKFPRPTSFNKFGEATGEPYNLKANRYQMLLFSLNNNHDFKELFDLETNISWSSQNIARRQEYFAMPWFQDSTVPDYIKNQIIDPNSLRNKYVYYAENILNLKMIAKKEFNKNLTVAIGDELSLNSWGAPWGESRQNFRMGDKSNIISGPDSYCYGYVGQQGVDSTGIFVGDGWSTFTYSLFSEINYNIFSGFTTLLSMRMDKDSYSDYLFSPRLALIYDLDQSNILKLVAQKSQRMNTAEELFLQNRAKKISDPETLQGLELLYSSLHGDNFMINASAFVNKLEVLSWYDPDRTTRKTGDLTLAGLSFDLQASYRNLTIGFNHTFIKQLSWKLAENVNSSGISYSDYLVQLGGSKLTGYGNDLNNWSNNITKLFINYNLINKKLILHLDSHIFWRFEGAKNGLEMIKNSSSGNLNEKEFTELVNFLERENFFRTDFRLNASITYQIFESLGLSLHIQNLFGTNNNLRYTYEAGFKNQDIILRTAAVQEPLTAFLKLNFQL